MTIHFAGLDIKGAHGVFVKQDRELKRHLGYFWALHGEAEIVGGRGGRTLTMEVWIHDAFKRMSSLESHITDIEAKIGSHGTVSITYVYYDRFDDKTVNTVEEFPGVTFTRFERVAIAGRTSTAPIRDIAGVIDEGWVQPAKLHFYQLQAS